VFGSEQRGLEALLVETLERGKALEAKAKGAPTA